MRQPKAYREVCKVCGKPGTKWNPLPHDHKPVAKPTTAKDLR